MFSIDDIVVCEHPSVAGASTYPVFGIVTNITKLGKFRITIIGKDYPDSDKNKSGIWGYTKLIKPIVDNLTKNTVLTKYEPDSNALIGSNKNKYSYWKMYDPTKDYFDVADTGD